MSRDIELIAESLQGIIDMTRMVGDEIGIEPRPDSYQVDIVWGYDIDREPETYTFATKDELLAFKRGIDIAMGWDNYEVAFERHKLEVKFFDEEAYKRGES